MAVTTIRITQPRRTATIRSCRCSRFTMPSTKDMLGTLEQWKTHRDDPQSIFVWSDGQLEAAQKRHGYIGRVAGVDCYLAERPLVVAN